MSRYDGLIIPRSYSEYINKTDAATLQQALQLPGVLSGAVAAGDNKAVTSNAVNGALAGLIKTTNITINASEISTKTSWITKTIVLPNQNNKIITAQITGYTDVPAILTYWGFELRVISTDGSNGLIAIRKTIAEDWGSDINILIIYY